MKPFLKRVALSILILFSLGAAYPPLSDKFFSKHSGGFEIEKHNVEYTIYLGEGFYKEGVLAKELALTSEKVINYAKSLNYRTKECRPVSQLDIYTVDLDILNDRARFDEWDNSDRNIEIWGLYDKIPESSQRAAIILTDQGSHNSKLLAHEVAHYWHHRFCWDFYTDIDTEAFALRFENTFME